VLIKQTAWLLVKTVVIGGLISASLVYLADEPAELMTITPRLANIIFW
jgi:hypothetical protein